MGREDAIGVLPRLAKRPLQQHSQRLQSLLFRSEAVDEDVGKAQRRLSPMGGVVDIVGHAHERAQKVFGRDVGAYLAGLRGAVEQRTDGLCEAVRRIGVKL